MFSILMNSQEFKRHLSILISFFGDITRISLVNVNYKIIAWECTHHSYGKKTQTNTIPHEH